MGRPNSLQQRAKKGQGSRVSSVSCGWGYLITSSPAAVRRGWGCAGRGGGGCGGRGGGGTNSAPRRTERRLSTGRG